MSDSVSDYLRIPEEYGQWLGGLRWSASGDVVEDGDGDTFAFSPQIGLFLEGFLGAARPIHFAHVLHLLHLLGHGKLAGLRVPPEQGDGGIHWLELLGHVK